MVYKKGESGNPNGRPPREASLTYILGFFSDDMISLKPGMHRVERKIILARMIWDGVVYGRVVFPDGRQVKLKTNEWINFVKWLYTRVDGSPPQAMDITSGDEPLQGGGGIVVILPSNGRELEDQAPIGAANDIS